MNRIVISGVAVFLAVVGLSLLGGENKANAGGGGVYGCSGGYVVAGCSGCHGGIVSGCYGCYGRRVRVRSHQCGCNICASACHGVAVQKGGDHPATQKGAVATQKGISMCSGYSASCAGHDPCSCSGRLGLFARLRARHACSGCDGHAAACGCCGEVVVGKSGGDVVQKGGVVQSTQKGAHQK